MRTAQPPPMLPALLLLTFAAVADGFTAAIRPAAFPHAVGPHRATTPVATVAATSSMKRSDLEAVFFAIDADSSGTIDRDELKEALDRLGYPLGKERADQLFEKFDTDGSGAIEFEEVR